MSWRRRTSADFKPPQQRPRVRSDGGEKARLSDEEESRFEYEEEDNYSPASSKSANSSQPMLTKAFHNNRPLTPRMFRFPNSIMRWTCLILAAAIVFFIVTLVRMSYKSDEAVRAAIEQDKITPKPAVWEDFPFLKRYYGGVRSLVPRALNKPEYPGDEYENAKESMHKDKVQVKEKRALLDTVVFDPYPNYTSPEYIEEYGRKVNCFLNKAGTLEVPRVRVYEAIPDGFPDPITGSYDLFGIRDDVCYDRFGRLGPYGLGYSLHKGGSGAMQEGEREGADAVWSEHPEVDFRSVNWADVQARCVQSNAHRFRNTTKSPTERWRTASANVDEKAEQSVDGDGGDSIYSDARIGDLTTKSQEIESKLPRNAIVIRTWHDYSYTAEDLIYLRALITELSILSGAEYVLHFLIQLKDDNIPIWSDEETYQRILRDSLPDEFRGMGTLWSERQMGLFYGGLEETWMRDLPVHGVYRSTFMPMQYFAYQHPEFDFFWNWEMDARNTGHWYHFFDSISTWAKKQPRKYLWERNGRFYVPSEHGSWEDFGHMVRIQTEHGTNSVNNMWSGLGSSKTKTGDPNAKISGDKSIWGPERPADDDVKFDTDPVPPTTFDKDKSQWGVGEEADLITFNPIFDPDGTTWLLADDTTGYNITRGRPPRRTAIITASRLSRKLLLTMHRETAINRHTMFSEMWPASCALHHGLKAVYAPHPTYIDRKWPTKYLESVFNAGRNGATGGARTSVFGEREHNFRGSTWYYNAGFPEALWHRWVGLKIHNDGGEMWETAGEGRMCLPAMMIHPIKRVELPQEGRRAD